MSNTTDEFWQFNNISLNSQWWNTTTFGGSRWDLPLFRGNNYAIPYRDGQMWRPKALDQRKVSLAMWVAGVDQSTLQPALDQRLAFNNNFQQLRTLLMAQGVNGSALGTLTRRWFLTQNGVTGIVTASALAEMAGPMTPAMSGRTRTDLVVDFLLADPYFYGAQQSQTLAYNVASNVLNLGDGTIGRGQSSSFGGQPFTIVLNGPLTNPTVTNLTMTVSVTVGYTIASGHSCTLNVLDYTAIDDTGISHLGVVSHQGARPWMVLDGAGGGGVGNNSLKLTSTNGADTGNAVITWSPPYY